MAKKSTKKVEKVVEPIVLDCGKAIEGKVFKGQTFELTKTNKGICYHCFGGYSIFVTPNNIALYETLNDLIENQETYNKLTGQEREDFDLNLSCIAYILNVPLFSFSSAEFSFSIATQVIQFLQKTYDDAMKEPLKDETPVEDLQFKEAVLGLEEVKEALKEENS